MKDPNDTLQEDQAQLATMIKDAEAMPRTVDGGGIEGQGEADQQAQDSAEKEKYKAFTAAGRLDGLWAQTEKKKDLTPIETGFPKLDDLLGVTSENEK